ncbi:laccase, partial [Genlisea aurea]
ETYRLKVLPGKKYLLRIINAALNAEQFFRIAGHRLTVVAVDATYTNPYDTDVVVITPGQTVDVLLTTDQLPRRYYMAAHPYSSATGLVFANTTTRALLVYNDGDDDDKAALMPSLPAFNDTPTAHEFYSNITSKVGARFWVPVPKEVDYRMLITIGLGLSACDLPGNQTCVAPFGMKLSASMNNVSFQFPSKLSMLEAFHGNVEGIYTADFPDAPPTVFDYTNTSLSLDRSLVTTTKSTKVKKLRFNSTVEVVFQNTALLSSENHPMHLHGFNFHVLAQGFGNYDPATDREKFNFVNPQIRNTIGVPVGGWAVVRFQANNPGIWFVHCHLDVHASLGFAMAFEVENGPTPETTLPPPPRDLPRC